MSQFNPNNQELMRRACAPFTRNKDKVGGRQKYEMYHKEEIQYGGDVYGIDNMTITTPKNHINIHSKKG
ncbi:hypothetical protein [Photobacterium nomapromontoriensis]|uniref:hypothetical protein n=1 Tax=Photobacterium nomapromontoriensis TaxID=2910237 RepID=UPI003D140AC1